MDFITYRPCSITLLSNYIQRMIPYLNIFYECQGATVDTDSLFWTLVSLFGL